MTVTPQQPGAGDTVSLRVTPSGVFFAQPVTVEFEYPPGTVPNALTMLRQSLAGSDALVATVVNPATRTVTAQLTTFGGSTLRALASVPTGRRSALGATALADPPVDENAALMVVGAASVDLQVQYTQARIDALLADAKFGPAYALQISLAGLIQRAGQDGYERSAPAFLHAAHDTACATLNRAIASAQAATITQFGQSRLRQEPILYWQAAVTRISDQPCAGDDPVQVMHDVIAKELAFARPKVESGVTPSDFAPPSDEVKDAREVIAILRQLQRTDASTNSAQGSPNLAQALSVPRLALGLNLNPFVVALQSEFIDPMLVPARNAAWNLAKESGTTGQYAALLDGFGPVPSLQQDAQFVRTGATITSADNANYTLDIRAIGIGRIPDLPTDPVRAVSVAMRGGTLQIGGDIAVLACPAPGNEKLTVTFDGIEVASIASSNDKILSGAVSLPTFTAAGLLAAAGLPVNNTGTHTLVLHRTASACATRMGLTDDVLATVTLDFGAPEPPLKRFEDCYFVQGNALPADGQRADTYQIARNGRGSAALYFRNLASNFQLDNVIYPAYSWPGESPTLSDAHINYFDTPLILNLAFTVDGQGKRHLDGTIRVDPSYDPGAGPSTISATCRNDLP